MKTEWSYDNDIFSVWVDLKSWVCGVENLSACFCVRLLCVEFVYWKKSTRN